MKIATLLKSSAALSIVASLALSACGGGDSQMTGEPPVMPEDVDLSDLTAGFMAMTGIVQVAAGQSVNHGDIAFSCAAGGADCEVTVTVDANGDVIAMSTGGMVTAMNSDAYNMRITTLAENESILIHLATGADRVKSGDYLSAQTSITSSSHYQGVVQTHSDFRYAIAQPWHDSQGTLNFSISLGSGLPQEDLDPLDFLGRSVDTTNSADTTTNEDSRHGLGGDWRAFEVKKEYAGAGTLTVNIATDAKDTDMLEQPWSGYGDLDLKIELSDIPPLPAGHDWQGVAVENGLVGSLDGEPGRFTCAPNLYCYLEFDRNGESEGYYPGGAEVIFTPDDTNRSTITLESETTIDRLPPANYLVFGYWSYVPEDIASSDDYDFGVLAGGGDPFSTSVYNLAGTATYAGSANGKYYTGVSSASPSVESFDADVALTADFDSMMLGGRVDNFRFRTADNSFPTELQLASSSINEYDLYDSDGNFFATRSEAAGEVADGQPGPTWFGTWQAKFYGNGLSPTDHPTGVAGTFGATNDEDGLVGAFGAHKKP